MDIAQFKRQPVLGILRGADRASIDGLVECVIDAGLETLEITMNTAEAPRLIERAVAVAGRRLTVGAGTVLSLAELDAAVAAGASFAVMPTLVADVVDACARRGIPSFPGALTPQEIHAAWQAGATMVKLFPAGVFGPGYIKEIKGPFADVELLACGGVDTTNVAAYFANGAAAVAFGGSIFKKEWLAQGAFDQIGAAVRALLDAYHRRGGTTQS